MKKVIVIGCPGPGKTTFAEKLKEKTNLPLYYLDALMDKYAEGKRIVIFKSREEADEFLREKIHNFAN